MDFYENKFFFLFGFFHFDISRNSTAKGSNTRSGAIVRSTRRLEGMGMNTKQMNISKKSVII